MTNIETVHSIYQAFGAGDVDTIVSHVADDVTWDADWDDHFAQRAGLAVFTPRRGPAGVREFFAYVAGLQVSDFQVLDLMASDHQVAVQVVIELAYPGGGRYRDEELHLWTFGADGKVAALRHYVDTAKHIAAAAGEDTVRQAAALASAAK